MNELRDAGRRRVRSIFWITFCTVPALAVLVGLGTWQLERLGWKEAQIAIREERSQGPAIAFPDTIDDPAALEFMRVRVTGQFQHDREVYLSGRTDQGVVGLHVVTPFLMADGRGLLIDRGWIPPERQDPATRPKGQIAGTVTLEGLVRIGGWKGSSWFQPKNRPGIRLYHWVDVERMGRASDLPRPITEVYLEAVASEVPGGFPRGGQTRIALRNDHLEYALTWYGLAVALLVIYLLFVLRRQPR